MAKGLIIIIVHIPFADNLYILSTVQGGIVVSGWWISDWYDSFYIHILAMHMNSCTITSMLIMWSEFDIFKHHHLLLEPRSILCKSLLDLYIVVLFLV